MCIDSILKAGHYAPSADNSQPWRFRILNKDISVEYDSERVAGGTFGPEEPATLIAMGGVLENMLQAAKYMDLQSDIQLGGIESNSTSEVKQYFSLSLCEASSFSETGRSVAEHPLFARHTNRFPYLPPPLPTEIMNEVNGIHEGCAQLKVFNAENDLRALAALARQASEVRFQTQEVHEWLARSLRYTQKEVEKGDGLDLATIPMPPGGGFFMKFLMDWKWMSRLNKLGAYKLMATLDVKLLEQAKTVLAVVGGSSPAEVMDAGRVLTRAWIQLNAKGIAVQPYYVVSDQLQRRLDGKVPARLGSLVDQIAIKTNELMSLQDGQRLHMLLRIGYPSKDPVRSKRLPLDTVCHGIMTDG